MPAPPLWMRPLVGGSDGLAPRDLFVYAALFGSAAGLLEALYLTGRQQVTGLLATGYHIELLWMAPLSGAVTFVAIAAVLTAAAALARTHVGVTPSTFVFAFLALHGVMQSPGIPIHPLAELILSLGAASMVAKAVADRAAGVSRFLRRAPACLVSVWAVLIVFAALRLPSLTERRALEDLPAARAGLPNVLLIILDTVRAANLGLYGYERDTSPQLSQWAGSGIVFERAYSTAPWTLPSHATLFSGRYPFETRTGIARPLDADTPTLAAVLASHGYETAGFVANLLYTAPTSGLQRGFARYQAHRTSVADVARSYWLPRTVEGALRTRLGLSTRLTKDGRHVTAEFFGWLDRRGDRPFFAFLNYFDAHDPYEPPEPWRSRFGPGPSEPWGPHLIQLGQRSDSAGQRMVREWVHRYDGGIAYLDHQLGLVRERLEAEGLLEETIVVITSDHGETWGEHRLMGHLNALYVPVLHVPLVVSYPGQLPSGRRIERPVTLRDVPATILDLAGLTDASPLPGTSLAGLADGSPLPGSSLAGPMRGEGSPSTSSVLAELYAYQPQPRATLFEGDLHYLYFSEGHEELYDLKRDPDEANDLSSLASYAPVLDRLRAKLRRMGVMREP